MGKYTFTGKAAVSVAAVAALALSGCASVGGGGDDNNNSGGGGGNKVVSVAETNAFTGANPGYTKTNLDINGKIASATREGFYFVNPEMKVQPNEGFGTYKKVSDDPLTVEYELKDSEWSDGNKVDQADMMLWWAINSGYYNDKSEDGKKGNSYFTIAGSTDILGHTDKPKFSEDGKKFTLTYDKPQADWDIAFTADQDLQPAHVVAKHAGMSEEDLLKTLEDETKGDPKAPKERPELTKIAKSWDTTFNFTEMPKDEDVLVSNGPYKIAGIDKGNSITLKRNENYKGDHEGKLDEITVRFIGDATAQIQALRNGEVDIMAPNNVNKDTMDQVKGIEDVNVLDGDQLAYDHLDLNFGKDVFKDKDTRDAFLKTIPRQQIVDQLIKPVKEDANVLNSQLFVSSQKEPYENTVSKNDAENLYGEVDIEGAKKLLGGKTPTVRILYNNENPQRVDSFQLIKESAEKAGFKVQDLGDPNWSEKLSDGDYEASLFGWVSPGVGTEALSQIFKTGGGGNYNKYSNKDVDKLVDEARSNLDEKSRDDQMAEIDKHTFDDAYGLPLFQSPGFFGVKNGVEGIQYMANQRGVFWNVWEWDRK